MKYSNIYTLEETAKMLKISINELRKLMTLKQISYFEIGEETSKRKVKRFREIDILDFISKNIVSSFDVNTKKE